MANPVPGKLTMEKLVSLCQRRGFIFPSSEIYGGLASTWDYGPVGVELKRNVKEAWWRANVHERDDMVGLDTSILMNPRVWEASGHVTAFSDPLVECKECHQRWRADDLPEEAGGKCPACGELRLRKKVSAAAFHLKGTGWYVTDFRDKDKKKANGKGDAESKSESKSESSSDSKSDSKSESSSKSSSAPIDSPPMKTRSHRTASCW